MEAMSVGEIVKAVSGKLLIGKEEVLITGVTTNSSEGTEQGLFIPLIGERVDAHDFILQAFSNGAAAVLTSRHNEQNIGRDNVLASSVWIGVKDTKEALQRLAAYYRNKFTLPVIGITGSVGKTTTKEMIAAALETKLHVLKTSGNMNSQVGVALMMFRLTKDHQAAVIEMGVSEEGEMEKLVKMAQPSIAVMTNIGVSHIAQLGTKENIRKEKLNIINGFQKEGILYICGEDPLLKEVFVMKKTQNNATIDVSMDIAEVSLEKLKAAEVAAYGTEDFCGYNASHIETAGEETSFLFHAPGEESIKIVLGVLGIHNVYNGLAALAIALRLGISAESAGVGLRGYKPIAMRGQIYNKKGIKIVDDTYNASPDSIISSMNVLLELEGAGRKVAVLADVLELGEHSYQCHYDVGRYIADKKIDLLVTVGEGAAAIREGVRENSTVIQTESFLYNEEAANYLKGYINRGDILLVKGSRGMHTEEVIKMLLE